MTSPRRDARTWLTVAAALLVTLAGDGARADQEGYARALRPEMILFGPGHPQGGPPVVVRLRVWASTDARAQSVSWHRRFRALIERINGSLVPWPNVRFEIVEQRAWERDARDLPMQRILDEVTALDAGRDVDLVVGFVSALPLAPANLH